MSICCFRPLEAKKWQKKLFSSPKKGFLGPRNKVFHILWPPEAKNAPPHHKKKTDFKKKKIVTNASRLFSAFGGQKTAKETIFKY